MIDPISSPSCSARITASGSRFSNAVTAARYLAVGCHSRPLPPTLPAARRRPRPKRRAGQIAPGHLATRSRASPGRYIVPFRPSPATHPLRQHVRSKGGCAARLRRLPEFVSGAGWGLVRLRVKEDALRRGRVAVTATPRIGGEAEPPGVDKTLPAPRRLSPRQGEPS